MTTSGLPAGKLSIFSNPVESKRPLLMIGYFLSSSLGTRGVGEDLAIQLKKSGWNVIVTSNKSTRAARLVDMVKTVFEQRHNYAIAQVDVYSGLAFFWAEIICRLLRQIGKPYILSLHGGNLPIFAERWPKLMTRLLHSAAAVTTPSRYLLEQMHSYRADLLLLPNALDLSAYTFRLRQDPSPRVIWLRAFHRIYNPSLAARVISLLADEFPDLQLTMIGPDKRDGSLQGFQELAKQLRVADRVLVPGGIPKEQVPAWLSKSDIFLNTSSIDNTPVSLLEAMACGLCVVSTNVGGIPYLLEHEKDSLLVPPNDPTAMSSAARRILAEPELARYLSRNARRKAEEFDWSVNLAQWQTLLASVG